MKVALIAFLTALLTCMAEKAAPFLLALVRLLG